MFLLYIVKTWILKIFIRGLHEVSMLYVRGMQLKGDEAYGLYVEKPFKKHNKADAV